MVPHDLEIQLTIVENRPWFKNLALCDRSLSIDDVVYSTNTLFFWKPQKNEKYQQLLEERNMPGALFSL